jgi:RNA polymerase sigma-70 factor (ECF subfamily)
MATSPEQNQRLQEWLAAAGRRDGASVRAFEALYQSTSSKLFGVALRILRREDWAEEVLQECYVSIWKHSADYQLHLSAPMTWMTSIVRNRCLDVLRRPNFEDATDDDAVFEGFETDDPGPLALLEQSTEAGAIARCMAGLDEKQQIGRAHV